MSIDRGTARAGQCAIAMAEDVTKVPVFQEYMNPLLEVLRQHARPLAIEALDRAIADTMQLPPEVAKVPHDPERPDRTEVSYRIAWARTYLKQAGFIDNPQRGRWVATAKGTQAGKVDAYALASEVAGSHKKKPSPDAEGFEIEVGENAENDEPDEELSAARVSDELATQLRTVHAELELAGELLAPAQVEAQLQRFRALFGPEALAQLDGDALLQRMHGRGRGESLVYWLEFKNDDEFSAKFGSIGGGSALKFGIYLSAESGQWMTGPSAKQERLSVEEAVTKVRSQRDQMLAGARVLAALPRDRNDIDYVELQRGMERAAPDLAETSWGHKYYALLYPDVLEPFHGEDYQTHQLFKLLKIPGSGRYENARIFAGVAAQLGISLLDLGGVLNRRNGTFHAYWRIGSTVGTSKVSEWDRMATGGFAALGWEAIGDLRDLTPDTKGKEALRAKLADKYPGEPAVVTKASNQIFNFVTRAAERDVILAMEGGKVRGVGKIAGPYYFKAEDGPFPHRRQVEWLRVGDWPLPRPEGILTTFVQIRKPVNIVAAEARLIGIPQAATIEPASAHPVAEVPRAPLSALSAVVARIHTVLQRKRQVILHGPPGTGKTYWAKKAADELAARAWFETEHANLSPTQRGELRDQQVIQTCSFHPAYGYEDFLEGYRPSAQGGSMSFSLRDGTFKKLCLRAAQDTSGRPYYLLIDEINRGDIPRIFGELLTVLEREKRDETVTLPLSGEPFSVPDNVYLIGTMNTADRSIALLDAALRRRFGFVELLPDSTTLAGVSISGLPLAAWLDELNRKIVAHAGRDARHLQVGHSYLLPSGAPVRDLGRFVEILRDDIFPLLEEYCYEDFDSLTKILGSTIVLRPQGKIDSALFEPSRQGELIQALLSAFDTIVATRDAVQADSTDAADSDDDDDEGDEGVTAASAP